MQRGWAGKLEAFERHKAAALETLKEGIVVTGAFQRRIGHGPLQKRS